jgi:membrane-associated protein
MELISQAWDLISHINEYLEGWVQKYPVAVYGILFAIIFAETGLVVTPFLPGDSLLFAVGAVAARPEMGLNVWLVSLVILIAAILGDSVNYWIGRNLSQWMMRKFPRLVKQDHIDKTNAFFEKYGGKTLIIARFVPIVRTFAPFVAGSGRMDYGKFMYFNVVGAILWVVIIIPAGYFFGQLEVVKKNFELVVIGIIVVSLIPGIVGFIQARTANRRALAEAEAAASGE